MLSIQINSIIAHKRQAQIIAQKTAQKRQAGVSLQLKFVSHSTDPFKKRANDSAYFS